MRIFGGTAELAALEEEWARAARGEFRGVLLLGDAGIGKSRLAAAVLERHFDEALGLGARASALGSTASFALWVEALERHLRTLPGDEVRRLAGGLLDDLARLLRSAAAARGAPRSGSHPGPACWKAWPSW